MSADENDLWPVQIGLGEKLISARRFDQMVVAISGELAMMRTVHPLDFARTKLELSNAPRRDPYKAGKDALQAKIVQRLAGELLPHLQDKVGDRQDEQPLDR